MNQGDLEATTMDFIYATMAWMDPNLWVAYMVASAFAGGVGMAPMKVATDMNFPAVFFVVARKILLYCLALSLVGMLGIFIAYALASGYAFGEAAGYFAGWISGMLGFWWSWLLGTFVAFRALRFVFQRYLRPVWSKFWRSIRILQSSDLQSDIRDEHGRFQAIRFRPQKFYRLNEGVFLGLACDQEPVVVPWETWRETHLQLIGATRFGKGVVIGCILDQAIRVGHSVIYIDPKGDHYAPHIMRRACDESGRRFISVALHDDGPGAWSPFRGGRAWDRRSRFYAAFDLDPAGSDADFYKVRERSVFAGAFEDGTELSLAKIKHLASEKDKDGNEVAPRVLSTALEWSSLASLQPASKRGLSIERSLLNDAVLYVNGSLDDIAVRAATKVLIHEVVQEARRLRRERKTHLTVIIDEVSFLVSAELVNALATAAGNDVNFVLAYQDQHQLLNTDERGLPGAAVLSAVNTNSQLKLIFGGTDADTAEWVAKTSGEKHLAVSHLERTEITTEGGEIWGQDRIISRRPEPLIPENVTLTLPPRVGVFFEPGHLARILRTSWIDVESSYDSDDLRRGTGKVKDTDRAA